MTIGTQILYRPAHVTDLGNTMNGVPLGCEAGFVVGSDERGIWCRFWRPLRLQLDQPIATAELRTKSCSELCHVYELIEMRFVPQYWIDELITGRDWGWVFQADRTAFAAEWAKRGACA